jgi:ectoine hydroxylase-related dioxygenase (phytanoyl-CoA dioxygenase family)
MQQTTINHHLATIGAQGYTIVENAIEPDLVDALNDALLRLEHDQGIRPGANVRRPPHHPHLQPAGPRPGFRAGSRARQRAADRRRRARPGCLVSSLSSISIDPGETAQPIHADDTLLDLPRPHPAVVCNSMWALTDFTERTAPPASCPGSHRTPDKPDYGAPTTAVPAEMARGSVLIWHGSLWHGGGANRSSARRVGIAMNYCAGFIRQQENQQLGIPLERVRAFAPRLQGAGGIRHLQAPDRPHRQAQPGRPRRGRRLHLGLGPGQASRGLIRRLRFARNPPRRQCQDPSTEAGGQQKRQQLGLVADFGQGHHAGGYEQRFHSDSGTRGESLTAAPAPERRRCGQWSRQAFRTKRGCSPMPDEF